MTLEYNDWPQSLPPRYEPEEMKKARDRFSELTKEVDILQLVYVDEAGGPVSGPSRYHTGEGGDRPIILLDDAPADLISRIQALEAVPVSVSIFRAVGFENRHQLRSAQIQGVAVLDAAAGPTSVSIRPVHIAWHDADMRPPRGSLVFED